MHCYRIADLTVRYASAYTTLAARSLKYSCPESDDALTLSVDPAQIEAFRPISPGLNDDLREYMLMGKAFYEKLIEFGGMMLHASAVVVDDRAYLFSAPSGTGKSTHTELWLRLFGTDAYILNDDKPALRVVDGTLYAYGTPFSGKYDISENRRVPLAGIAFIERSETNSIARMAQNKAIYSLLNQTARPASVSLYSVLLQNLDRVLRLTPIYQLKCNMDIEAAHVAYETMRKGNCDED